jgi:hypothetical protein
MIAAEFGSTGALEIFRFHKLSAGKGRKPFKLPPWPVLIPLHALGGGGGGGGFPPDGVVTVTFNEPDALLPGLGLVTLIAYIPAVVSEPVAVSFVAET